MSAPACISPFDVAEGQLVAYNAQELDAFCTFYDENVVVADLNGQVTSQGLAALRDRYEKLFAQHPGNHADLMNRIVVGHTVIDHERVSRVAGGETFDVAAIYTISDARIVRVDFVK